MTAENFTSRTVVIFTPQQTYLSNQTKDDKMGETRGTYEEEHKSIQSFCGETWRKEQTPSWEDKQRVGSDTSRHFPAAAEESHEPPRTEQSVSGRRIKVDVCLDNGQAAKRFSTHLSLNSVALRSRSCIRNVVQGGRKELPGDSGTTWCRLWLQHH